VREFRAHVFFDRAEAGRALGEALAERGLQEPLLVLGLPRGGVPVALEVARALHARLDVLVVRKVGMPGQPELAIGAVATGDVTVREEGPAARFAELAAPFERLAAAERAELARRERAFRPGAGPLDASGHTVVLVDDGLATGATMIAAVLAARRAGAGRVVAAAPVASRTAAARIAREADDVVILQTPPSLFAIGEWYERFEQLDDEDVRTILERAGNRRPAAGDP
jgi:predicted phosphoribosyltransferase